MKAFVISALIALSMCTPVDSAELQPPVFEVPQKWEQLQEDSVKMRNTVTQFFQVLKDLVISDNPEVGQIIANTIDGIQLKEMALMNRIDAEIQAKTLTTDLFLELFNEIHDTYHFKIIPLLEESQHFSLLTQNLFAEANVKVVVDMSNQAVAMKVLLIGD